jgi:iron complex outermembrane receptor protein
VVFPDAAYHPFDETALEPMTHTQSVGRRSITRVTLMLTAGPLATIALSAPLEELKRMSLEQLLQVEVTLASRSGQPASEAAAAIQVITSEDIRRSGARSIPEALRLASNLEVAQSGSRSWAISARGFNAPFSNKLLVLMDGRSVYTPLFSGVFWDMQDTPLEDIERIEVISGPGATLWGANAVNGIINIVTKNAHDTRGMLATVSAGGEERAHASIRFGDRVGDDGSYRIYAKYLDRDDSELADGTDAQDAWNSAQVGFRFDRGGQDHSFTLQGDVYDGTAEQFLGEDGTQSGANLLARWTRAGQDGQRLQIQSYFDHTHTFAPGDYGDDLDTLDVDLQYEWPAAEHHRLMAGGSYRFTRNEVDNLPGGIAFLPAELDLHLAGVFIQDEISLAQHAKLTIGSKFEHNDYTGLEVQPSVRASYNAGRQFFWGALARAVRTPSRIDRHLYFPGTPPFLFAGGPEFDSEKVITAELGWRRSFGDDAFISATVYSSEYDDIRTTSASPPFVTRNDAEGRIYGLELDGAWQVTANWRIRAGYSLIKDSIGVKEGREDFFQGRGELFDPQQQVQVRSSLNISPSLEWDVALRYIDKVENEARGFDTIPDYFGLDTRVGWQMTERFELAIVGQNLLSDRHPEFGFRYVERAAYAKLIWRKAAH